MICPICGKETNNAGGCPEHMRVFYNDKGEVIAWADWDDSSKMRNRVAVDEDGVIINLRNLDKIIERGTWYFYFIPEEDEK
jgi:hypothetical protein